MDGQIRLRWTSHQGTVLSMFDALLSTESMVDVTLACDGQYLRAHKVVLSACSPYFQELLSLDGSKNPFPIVFLKDVKYLELKALIQYMYRGEVNISQDELPSLLAVAQALKIRGLAEVESTKPNMSSDTLILPQSIPNVSNIHGSSPSIPATSVPSQPQSSSTIRPPPPSTYTSAPVTKRSRLHDTHHHVQSKSYPQPQDPFASIPTQPPPKTFYPPTTIPIEQEKIDYHRVTIVEESESIFGPEEEEVIKIEDGDNGLITADVDFELENRNENDDNSMSQSGFGESWNPGSEDGEENSAGAGSDLGVPGTSRSKTETEAQTGDRIGEGDANGGDWRNEPKFHPQFLTLDYYKEENLKRIKEHNNHSMRKLSEPEMKRTCFWHSRRYPEKQKLEFVLVPWSNVTFNTHGRTYHTPYPPGGFCMDCGQPMACKKTLLRHSNICLQRSLNTQEEIV